MDRVWEDPAAHEEVAGAHAAQFYWLTPDGAEQARVALARSTVPARGPVWLERGQYGLELCVALNAAEAHAPPSARNRRALPEFESDGGGSDQSV